MSHHPKILVTPLNWGLGHATRCIPLIETLQQQQVEVCIASDGAALKLLQSEFPKLPAFELPGWDIDYAGKSITLALLRQSAKLLHAVLKEHAVVGQLVRTQRIEAIISDNRLGCYSQQVPSVILTHQVNLLTPGRMFHKPANALNRFWMDKFEAVWIPDFPGKANLAGVLSHDHSIEKAHYIGALTRMRTFEVGKKYDVVVVLSGPEPKRSELEKLLIGQARHLTEQFLFVQGLPGKFDRSFPYPNIEMVSYLISRDLNEAILSGAVLISRSGYSTIMDLYALEQPAILIPTPGQSEQEYLADSLHSQGIFYTQKQEKLDLKTALEEYKKYSGLKKKDFEMVDFTGIVRDFLRGLNRSKSS